MIGQALVDPRLSLNVRVGLLSCDTRMQVVHRLQCGHRRLLRETKLQKQVFLSLTLALQRLAKAASNKAQEDREAVITIRHITSVLPVSIYIHETSFSLLSLMYLVAIYTL